jgi:hypothetical protein
MRTGTVPDWRRMHLSPRCGAHSRRTGQPCRGGAMANGRCRMHGGTNPGAPLDNTHGVSSGRFMREDRIAAKANTVARRSIRAMIRNTMNQWEGRTPRAMGKVLHVALMGQVADAGAIQEAARQQKAERLARHDQRQEAKAAQADDKPTARARKWRRRARPPRRMTSPHGT